jgi:hypothetical protein
MTASEIQPASKADHQPKFTISLRGRLAEKTCAINCKSRKDDILKELINLNFMGCLCYWEQPNTLVVGLLEDIGKYYPHW